MGLIDFSWNFKMQKIVEKLFLKHTILSYFFYFREVRDKTEILSKVFLLHNYVQL